MTPDKNDPRHYRVLADLLGGTMAEDVMSKMGQMVYLRALEALERLPLGEDREALVYALFSGVRASIGRREALAETELLKVQRDVACPELGETSRLAAAVRRLFKTIASDYSTTYAKEHEAGRNPSSGYWPWFGHELASRTSAMAAMLDRAERGEKLY